MRAEAAQAVTQEVQQKYIGNDKLLARKFLYHAINPFLNTVVFNDGRLQAAEEYAQNGQGIIFLLEHVSKRETLESPRFIIENASFSNRPIDFAVADHMRSGALDALGKITDTKMSYVHTPESKRKRMDAQDPVDRDEEYALLKNFASDMADTIIGGGFGVIFYQGGRRPTLYDPQNAEGILYMIDKRIKQLAKERGIPSPNYGIVPIGIGVNPENLKPENYEYEENGKMRGFKHSFNPRHQYWYNIGRIESIEEIRKRATSLSGKSAMKNMDAVVYANLDQVSMPDYIGEGPTQKDADFERYYPTQEEDPR